MLLVMAAPACAQSSYPALDPASVPGATAAVAAAPPVAAGEQQPVDFAADHVTYDDPNQIVTATGNIVMKQDGKTLQADTITYDIPKDKVLAEGNVALTTETGDVHHAERLELTQNMRSGIIQGMLSKLTDGTRFTASEGRRIEGVRTVMKDATYTPCKVCESNPEPLWQLKAEKVVHDEKNKTVDYKNARMEFAGVPFFYSPYFTHADPTVKRKSGLLRPKYGWSSDTGAYLVSSYYFGDIAPDKDATLTLRPTAERGVMLQGEWRQRFENGAIEIEGGGVESDRDEDDGRVEHDRKRGHLFARGRFDLSDTWRAGFGSQMVSDKSYLRLYDISNDEILENKLYAERLSGRDYTNIRAMAFRDIRLGIRPDQPQVVPELSHRMLGRPQGLFGGRWEAGVSSMYLHRPDTDEQDVQRASADLGWERRFVADSGIVTTVSTKGRVDGYRVRDNAAIAPPTDNETSTTRLHGVAGFVSSYPVKKRFESVSWLVEPVFGASLSPELDDTEFGIPNEDSRDVLLDISNLFDDNRFPGIDRQEDGARIQYGMKTGLYGDGGQYGDLYVGQSYRFDHAAYYPEGSGLENKNSAYVGRMRFGLGDGLQADYRFQFDSDNFASQRHELGGISTLGPLTTEARYLYINGIAGTEFFETREQAELGMQYRFTPVWRTYGSALQDLGQEPGLRRARLGLGYADECFSFALEGARNLTNDAAGESETVITARVGFKNIGEFSGPDILLRDDEKQ